MSYPKHYHKIDLHVHTTASDGSYSPRNLVALARSKGIDCLAITDHDTTYGLSEALEAGKEYGMEIIPGIELSTVQENTEIHVLGYYIDPQNLPFQETLDRLVEARDGRARRIVEKLNDLGYPIEFSEVRSKAPHGTMGRPHVALVMMDHGIIRSIDEGFDKYLSPGCPAYVPRMRLTPLEAIHLIKEAGGVPVLAHPGLGCPKVLLTDFVRNGLEGIEVFYPKHSHDEIDYYYYQCKNFNLIMTGGSDFHGHNPEDTAILGNIQVPAETIERLKTKTLELSSLTRKTRR